MGLSNAERQARWRERRAAKVEELRKATTTAQLAVVQAENDLLRQRVREFEAASEGLTQARVTIDGLLSRIEELEKTLVFERLRKLPANAEQTPVDASSEVARLKTMNKKLRAKVAIMSEHYKSELARQGLMTFKAASLIAKALHPDTAPSEEVRLEAFKAFSAWKADSKDAKRR
jgi:hypothetical protein